MSSITKIFFFLCLLSSMLGCGAEGEKTSTDTGDASMDIDGDGHPSTSDCDDNDISIHPGADELCDGIDNDCDGVIDEAPVDGITQWEDRDADGFGNPEQPTADCNPLTGYVLNDRDCDERQCQCQSRSHRTL